MKIEGTPKEIADFVLAVQGRQENQEITISSGVKIDVDLTNPEVAKRIEREMLKFL